MTMTISRRRLVAGISIVGACAAAGRLTLAAEPGERWFDFTEPLDGWETVSGGWAIEDVPGARYGRALVQRAIENKFNVIVAPGGPYGNVLVSVRFRPIAGGEDASGGIVFRFSQGRYYLVRANALEDNFRLYYYDGRRHMIVSTAIKAPQLGEWHQLQVTAKDDRIQAWLNDRVLIDQRDTRFAAGRIGLWTKADSITAFDSLAVLPMEG